MPIQAKLFIDNETYIIKSFDWGVIQGSDSNYQPTGKVAQRGLNIVMDAQHSSDFEDWAFESMMTKNLEIHMPQSMLGQGKTRVLKCFDCHLVGLNTHYNHQSNDLPTFQLNITCGGIEPSWSTAVYSEAWRKTFPQEGEVTVIEEAEKKLTQYYITNKSGEKIQDYKKDDIIVLNIETQNRIGDSLTINLNDAEYDFKYGETKLYNDTLENYIINNDLEQIELTVVEQKNNA